MKKILILIVICCQLLLGNNESEDLDSLPIKEYISMISNDLDMTFVLSDDIDESFTLMLPKELNKSDYLKILLAVLNKNDLTIEPFDNFFLISKNKDDKNKKELYSIQLKNVNFDTVKSLFDTMNDVKYNYISSNKTIVFNSTKEQFLKVHSVISRLDVVPKQSKLKITFVDTNLDKLKEYGTELEIAKTFTNTHNFFFNLLAYPFQVVSEVGEDNISQFHSFIKFMDTNNISKLISSPVLSLYDNKITKFSVVKNIPYIVGTTTTSDSNTTSITSYSYKDVGLKVNVTPQIYKDNVYLDLDITSESIISNVDDKPTTSKSSISQPINITPNKIFVLTGLNQSQVYDVVNAVPVLSQIPFLGWVFKMDSKNTVNSSMTIFMELINEDSVSIKDNEVSISLPKPNTKKELTEHEKQVNEILGISNNL